MKQNGVARSEHTMPTYLRFIERRKPIPRHHKEADWRKSEGVEESFKAHEETEEDEDFELGWAMKKSPQPCRWLHERRRRHRMEVKLILNHRPQ
jgi:hypothetical protein